MAELEETSIYVDDLAVKDCILVMTNGEIITCSKLLEEARKVHSRCYVEVETLESTEHKAEDRSVHTHLSYDDPYVYVRINRAPEEIEDSINWINFKIWMLTRSHIIKIEVIPTDDEEILMKEEMESLK